MNVCLKTGGCQAVKFVHYELEICQPRSSHRRWSFPLARNLLAISSFLELITSVISLTEEVWKNKQNLNFVHCFRLAK